MKINKNKIKYIELDEIYNNYLKPIMKYYIRKYGVIDNADKVEKFIDSVNGIIGYGFVEYNHSLYYVDFDDEKPYNNEIYYIENGYYYVLIPVE